MENRDPALKRSYLLLHHAGIRQLLLAREETKKRRKRMRWSEAFLKTLTWCETDGREGWDSWNLLQKTKSVGDLIDVEVSVLPRVNVDALVPALKHPRDTHTHSCYLLFILFCWLCLFNKERRTLSYLERISARSPAMNVSMSFFMSKSRREESKKKKRTCQKTSKEETPLSTQGDGG